MSTIGDLSCKLVFANKPYGVSIFEEGRDQVSLWHGLTIGDVTEHQNCCKYGHQCHEEIIHVCHDVVQVFVVFSKNSAQMYGK